MSVRIGEQAMKLREEYHLMDYDKVLVTLRPGVVWSYLKQDDRIVGIAFHGSARFAVDAIVETDYGATGKSVAAELDGVQLYFGDTHIDRDSEQAHESDLQKLGYSTFEEFRTAVTDRLEGTNRDRENKINIEGDTGILIGNDEFDKKVVLVAKDDSTVFTYEKKVYVVGGKNMVSVEGNRISIGGPDKRDIIIDKDGIRGLEELHYIGPAISRAVSSLTRSIPRMTKDITKSFKIHSHHSHSHHDSYVYDNVDEFDWPD